jgi:hypothetical protein
MPHDPVRAADAQAWLEKATLDLRSAEADAALRLARQVVAASVQRLPAPNPPS